MIRFLLLFDEVVIGTALVVPLLATVAVFVARWRVARGASAAEAWLRTVAEAAMVAGTVPWLVMALWPVDLPPGARRWHLVPLTEIVGQLSGPPGEAFVQIVANLMVFFTLGLCAPVRFPAVATPARLLLLGAGGSLAVEVCQQVFGTGRVFSVDDILLNGAGCLIGGLVSRRWWASSRQVLPGGRST